MSADVSFLLGYGGYCKLKVRADESMLPSVFSTDTVVPLLSGSYDRTMQVPMQNTFSVPADSSPRNKIRTGTGVYSFSGNLSFEMTKDLCRDLVSNNFFKRRSFLDIEMNDGEGKLQIPGAIWNSFNVQVDAGGIVQGAIAFLSCNAFQDDINVLYGTDYVNKDMKIEPYWQYGNEGIQSFQINFSRTATPVYLNEHEWIGPTYIRVGLLDVAASITCWESWFIHSSIRLGSQRIVFNNNSFLSSKAYQISGIANEGLKTYNINALGIDGNEDLFEIE